MFCGFGLVRGKRVTSTHDFGSPVRLVQNTFDCAMSRSGKVNTGSISPYCRSNKSLHLYARSHELLTTSTRVSMLEACAALHCYRPCVHPTRYTHRLSCLRMLSISGYSLAGYSYAGDVDAYKDRDMSLSPPSLSFLSSLPSNFYRSIQYKIQLHCATALSIAHTASLRQLKPASFPLLICHTPTRGVSQPHLV